MYGDCSDYQLCIYVLKFVASYVAHISQVSEVSEPIAAQPENLTYAYVLTPAG